MGKSLNNIIVIGDPIIDCYIKTNENNEVIKYEQREGGALNTFRNAKVLFRHETYFLPDKHQINLKYVDFSITDFANLSSVHLDPPTYYSILRINNQKDLALCVEEKKDTYYKWNLNQRMYVFLKHTFDIENSALILSDYNKGTLNRKGNLITSVREQFKFSVIDSRYRSLNLSYLKLSKLNIWRCTGQEYDDTYARNFDIIVWTNAEAPIRILDKNQNCIATIKFNPILKSKVKDTCGAGDTFTASLASYLQQANKKINLNQIVEACKFSIDCCQKVIQHEGTTVAYNNIYK